MDNSGGHTMKTAEIKVGAVMVMVSTTGHYAVSMRLAATGEPLDWSSVSDDIVATIAAAVAAMR